MAMEAVKGQIGIAVLPYLYAKSVMEKGEMSAPFGPPILTDYGYYLVYPEEDKQAAKIVAFRDWLLNQVASRE